MSNREENVKFLDEFINNYFCYCECYDYKKFGGIETIGHRWAFLGVEIIYSYDSYNFNDVCNDELYVFIDNEDNGDESSTTFRFKPEEFDEKRIRRFFILLNEVFVNYVDNE